MPTRPGPPVFSLTGNGAQRGEGVRTRRQIANAALIRHRQTEQRELRYGTHEVWMKLLAWRLEWENAILRYRDGNNNGEDNDGRA